MASAHRWSQWEKFFDVGRERPPGGWHRYLIDGYRDGVPEWRRRYALYLRSKAWEKRRDIAINRAKGRCQLCRGTERLQVHHVTYEHVGREQLGELRVVCKKCHKKAHAHNVAIPIDPETKRRMEAKLLKGRAHPPSRTVGRRSQDDIVINGRYDFD